ncbi:GSCFA domain-containing protein [Actibacterium ureilyticum]|uniref:GSCFA domain-containing protein n=1 Tax=Actibacterium ureilyticum TaxID=1590614 RepID=UPI000BAB028C|nr:GSCFA domain-containing protein [Actibacterium ureilyticum]
MTSSPYEGLEPGAFWRTGVSEVRRFPPAGLYQARFAIPRDLPVLTAGSCFAQHVGRALVRNGFNVIDTEPLPDRIANRYVALSQKFGYGLYSARYGNIYTMRQFLQLLRESQGVFEPAEPVWERDGRFFDAMRPSVEPAGLASPELVKTARTAHLAAIREALSQAGLIVFTLGLTEAWQHIESGTVYPTAPGTIAGEMDDTIFGFVNFRAAEIREDFLALRDLVRAVNPDMRFLLTVSPVPLTATASGQHVLPATIYSKSVLRAVAGELYEDFEDVDYFPSYEIIAAHPSEGSFFEENMRTVSARGVRRVMRAFLAAHGGEDIDGETAPAIAASPDEDEDLVCEEALLEAFNK